MKLAFMEGKKFFVTVRDPINFSQRSRPDPGEFISPVTDYKFSSWLLGVEPCINSRLSNSLFIRGIRVIRGAFFPTLKFKTSLAIGTCLTQKFFGN